MDSLETAKESTQRQASSELITLSILHREDIAIHKSRDHNARGSYSPEELGQIYFKKNDTIGEISSWHWKSWLCENTRSSQQIEEPYRTVILLETLGNLTPCSSRYSP